VVLALTAGLWLILRILPPTHITARPTLGPVSIASPQAGSPDETTVQLLNVLNQKLESLDLLKLLNDQVATRPATVHGRIFSTYIENFRLPLRYTAENLASQLESEANVLGAKLASPPVKTEDANGNVCYACSFIFPPAWVAVEVNFIQVKAPKLCLVIDDGGYQNFQRNWPGNYRSTAWKSCAICPCRAMKREKWAAITGSC
jgi:hypothetical protein